MARKIAKGVTMAMGGEGITHLFNQANKKPANKALWDKWLGFGHIYYINIITFLHIFCNEYSLQITCLNVLIHAGYDREKIIMKFIQLNSKVQKKGDRFKSKSSRSYLIWKLDISDKIILSNFKEKMDCLKTLLVLLKINGYLINFRRQIENSRG